MNIDPRKSEYSLVSHSQIKHIESEKIDSEINAFLDKGGTIKQLKSGAHAAPDFGLFDKSKKELAEVARSNKRRFFNYQCPKHAVSKHRIGDLACVKCAEEYKRDTK